MSDSFDITVEIEEPEKRTLERHPTDLLRVVLALLVTIVGFLLATVFNNVSEAITVEVVEGARHLPVGLVAVTLFAILMFALLLPVLAIGFLIVKKEWRRLLIGLVSSVIAMGLVWLVEAELIRRFGAPELLFNVPAWVCTPDTPSSQICISGNASLHIYYMAGGVAYFSSLVPWLSSKWKRFGWIMIAILAVTRMLQSLTPPLDELLVISAAYAVGAAVLLVFGTPSRRPRGRQIVDALHRSGLDVASLRRADVDARGSTPYFAVQTNGKKLFVKVLTPEERAADFMFRITRMFRLKGVGDERPFSSLKRAVEHEAVGSLMAASDGVKTPRLEAIAEIQPTSMLMSYAMIDGSSLDSVPPEDLTDGVLAGVWRQVATLREHRIAHRDLRLANVFLDADGVPWLIDFGFAELAATDGQLRSDVAELIASTSVVVGADRAVTAAIEGIGKQAVADASSRIQPLALSGATRDALKHDKDLDGQIREEIQRQSGIEEVQLEDLERIKGRTVLMIVGLSLAFYFLIPQITQTDFGALLKADWKWLPAILIASLLTYVGAAYNIMGSVPEPLRILPTTLAQFAGTFINRITPVKVGGMATNVRYMQKNGVDLEVAVAGVGVSSVGTMMIHLSLLAMSVAFIGKSVGDFIKVPTGKVLLIGGISIVAAIAVFIFVPAARAIVRTKVWPTIKKSRDGVVQVATSPRNAIMLFGGAFVSIMSYIMALWFSLEAFGGGVKFFGVAVVFLGAQALGQAAPTPGGVGAVEAAMIAAFTALGVDASVAVPTVFLYRIATFWLPILPGVISLKKLEADGAL